MPDQQQSFDQWCIVELFGRQVIAGRVTEQVIGGCSFVRVDVPAFDDNPPVTHFYGQGAIYGMTPDSEETVLAVLKHYQPRPINVYIPTLQLPSPSQERLDLEGEEKSDLCDCGKPFPENGCCSFCGARARYLGESD